MTLRQRLANPQVRTAVAADAVSEAQSVVKERGGVRGRAAKLGMETVDRLKPGFLERHVAAMLPDWADAIDPYWSAGQAAGDPTEHLVANAPDVADAMLGVSDAYVEKATYGRAIKAYERLRPHAPERIVEHMPRIASFVEKHTTE